MNLQTRSNNVLQREIFVLEDSKIFKVRGVIPSYYTSIANTRIGMNTFLGTYFLVLFINLLCKKKRWLNLCPDFTKEEWKKRAWIKSIKSKKKTERKRL